LTYCIWNRAGEANDITMIYPFFSYNTFTGCKKVLKVSCHLSIDKKLSADDDTLNMIFLFSQ